MRRRVLIGAAIAAACGLGLIAVGHSLTSTSGKAAAPIPSLEVIAAASKKAGGRLLAFTRTPRRPGNVLERIGVVGHSASDRPIGLRQLGDPSIAGRVLVVGCIHGDECAGSKIMPTIGGCPETRLAGRIVAGLSPEVTIWFHQHRSGRPLVRAWGRSVPAGRLLAKLARIPFRRLPWPAGTAPNWQNHRFPGRSSYVVELPPGPLPPSLHSRLNDAIIKVARRQAQVGED